MSLKNKLKEYKEITVKDLYHNFTKVELSQLLINFQSRQVTHKEFFHNYLALYMSNRNK